MSARTTEPVASWGVVTECLACVLLLATLAAGCGQGTSPAQPLEPVTAGEAAQAQSAAQHSATASQPDAGQATPDAGQATADAATTENQTTATPAVDSQLCEACRAGRVSEAREALEAGADVNARDENGSAAIMLAAFDGHTEIARLLIERKAEVNAIDRSGARRSCMRPADRTKRRFNCCWSTVPMSMFVIAQKCSRL